MAEQTPRGWTIPTPRADKGTWGDITNGAWRDCDGDVTEIENSVGALETSLKNLIVNTLNSQEPVGTIKYYNKTGPLPPAWAECDGTQGTPNIRDRVIVAISGALLGRLSGSKIWGSSGQTINTSLVNSHKHARGTLDAATHTGNTTDVALQRAHLPAEGLHNSRTFLTDRNTGQLAFDCGGSGQNVYRQDVGHTENMGSGAGHGHGMTHDHALTGETGMAGGHQHRVTVLTGSTYGARCIIKIRDLTVEDL